MTTTTGSLASEDPEITAISAVVSAMSQLPRDAQQRVLRYVANKFGVSGTYSDQSVLQLSNASIRSLGAAQPQTQGSSDGISPSAAKWMQRSALTIGELGAIFSIGADQIELVANSLPGKSKRNRMKNVALLMGIAAYLGTGAPRLQYDSLREACQHYGALDNTNFATHLRGFASEISGSKDTGFTLTARGLLSATTLIKSMVKPDAS
jgi:hypothetical protein